jgi:hypothetical protein
MKLRKPADSRLTCGILACTLVSLTACPANALTIEDIAPHIPTSAPIVWQAPTNHLPSSFRFYKKVLPRVFPDTTISNAIAIAPLPDKHFRWSAKKELCIDLDTCPCGHSCTFGISPQFATLSYSSPGYRNGSSNNIPDDDTLFATAHAFALQLGLDSNQLARKQVTTNICQYDLEGHLADEPCGHGITLSRRIDGIPFFGKDLVEGFNLELGSHSQIRFLTLIWPDLEPLQSAPLANKDQIISCIRKFKTGLLPRENEGHFFDRLKMLSKTNRLRITKITPYYMEGTYGEEPKQGRAPANTLTPIAELEATAEFENGTLQIQLVSPIVSTEIKRLLPR